MRSSASSASIAEIVEELKVMGVIEPQAQLQTAHLQQVNNGFPVYTTQLVTEMNRQRECVERQLKNIRLLGKASGNNFFMGDVLKEVYAQLGSTS